MIRRPDAESEADALIELFRGCFKRRTEIEAIQWKMNLSVWTSIVVAGWALHTRPEHLGYWSWLFLLIIPLHSFAVHQFDTSIKTAVTLALAYVSDLEDLIGHRYGGQPAPLVRWHIIQVTPTLVLTIVAIMLTW
jgi:hypothetical protein